MNSCPNDMIELRRSVGEIPALSRKAADTGTGHTDVLRDEGNRLQGHNNTDLTSQGGIIYVCILNQRCWDQAGTASENAVFCF